MAKKSFVQIRATDEQKNILKMSSELSGKSVSYIALSGGLHLANLINEAGSILDRIKTIGKFGVDKYSKEEAVNIVINANPKSRLRPRSSQDREEIERLFDLSDKIQEIIR